MTELRDYVFVIEAREPLSYGEETVGVKMLIKRINLFLPEKGLISIPVILGNAIRGVLRDIMAEVFIEETRSNLKGKPTWHAGALITLFSGGLLRGEERMERITAADIAQKISNLLKKLLPLSIMGCALPGIMVPSKIKVSIFYPVCKETEILIRDLVQKITDAELRAKLENAMKYSVEDFIIEVQMMRKDDTIKIVKLIESKDISLKGIEKPLESKRENSKETSESKERRPVQMLFYRQALAPGTLLIGKLNELMPLSKEERGLLILSMRKLNAIGGAVARGFGEIMIYNLPEDSDKDVQAFREFIRKNAEQISKYLAMSPDNWVKKTGENARA